MYKNTLKQIVSILDVFEHGLDLPYLLSLPVPFVDDLFNAQIDYLKEKAKHQSEAYNNG